MWARAINVSSVHRQKRGGPHGGNIWVYRGRYVIDRILCNSVGGLVGRWVGGLVGWLLCLFGWLVDRLVVWWVVVVFVVYVWLVGGMVGLSVGGLVVG